MKAGTSESNSWEDAIVKRLSRTSRLARAAAFVIAALAPASAIGGVINVDEIVTKDDLLESEFSVIVTLDNLRDPGSYLIRQPFTVGGAHWLVNGEMLFTGTKGLTNEKVQIQGAYQHFSNPHPGETSSVLFFPALGRHYSADAHDVAPRGQAFAVAGGMLFNTATPHPGGPHKDTFAGEFIVSAGSSAGPKVLKLFREVQLNFYSAHPPGTLPPGVPPTKSPGTPDPPFMIPAPPALALLIGGMIMLFGASNTRRQRSGQGQPAV